MLILAIDSTARSASVAVCESARTLAVYNIDNGLTQSELLLPMAESMLSSLKLSFSDIELFATSVGPGSFTGVRIGTALIKGLAFGKGVPCAAVSTLEALAQNLAGLCGTAVAVMDARRQQFYTALFSLNGGNVERLTEDAAMSADELARAIKENAGSGEVYLVGDGYEPAWRLLTERGVRLSQTPELLRLQNAASVARVAFSKYERGEYVSDTELLPTYLRLPQAERERLERQAAGPDGTL